MKIVLYSNKKLDQYKKALSKNISKFKSGGARPPTLLLVSGFFMLGQKTKQ